MDAGKRKGWPLAHQNNAASPPGGVGENRRQGFGRGVCQASGDQHRRRLCGLADTKVTKVPEVVRDASLCHYVRSFQADPLSEIAQPGIDAKVM